MNSKLRALWNHPAGPKTIHFWAPTFKWGLSLANISDFSKPPEELSYPQQAVIATTGIIWSRYCFVITPWNWNLFGVNSALACTGFYQLARKLRHDYSAAELPPPPPSDAGHVFTNEQEVQKLPIKVAPGNKFTVYIINYFAKNSPTVYVRCASKDDDLGLKSLNPGDYFHWTFRLNFWQTTLFYCRFQAGKIKSIDVFNGDLANNCETESVKDGNNCVWSVKEDGFYISNRFPPTNSTKIYDW